MQTVEQIIEREITKNEARREQLRSEIEKLEAEYERLKIAREAISQNGTGPA